MTPRFPVFSPRSLRLQIALAVIVVAAIAVVHVALQAGFLSLGSGASAERTRTEPASQETDNAAAEPRRALIKRGSAVPR